MCQQGYIKKDELDTLINQPIKLNYGEKYYSFCDLCLTEFNEILQDNPYHFSNLKILISLFLVVVFSSIRSSKIRRSQ